MKRICRIVGSLCCAATMVSCLAAAAATIDGTAAPVRLPVGVPDGPAARFEQPQSEMLLGAAAAGKRLVGVGDRGMVVLSDDGARSFRQAKSVPTRATLTSVCFSDSQHGWAVGHWGTILHTEDGGESWAVQRRDTNVDRPLFAVHCDDGRNGVAVGLWSLLLVTHDGGASWAEAHLGPPPGGGKADRNLFAVFRGSKGLVVAAEKGTVLLSTDAGEHWSYVSTGYAGSFWVGRALNDGTLLVGGLRGTVFRSKDGDSQWEAAASGTKSSITGFLEVGDKLLAVALDGVVLESHDDGRRFSARQREDRLSFTGLVGVGAEGLVALSKRGIVSDFDSAPMGPVVDQ